MRVGKLFPTLRLSPNHVEPTFGLAFLDIDGIESNLANPSLALHYLLHSEFD